MRALHITALAILAVTAVPAAAQPVASPCHPVSPTSRVVVTTHEGRSIHGTLLCLAVEQVLVAQDGNTTALPLEDVKRIQTRADPVWDGAVKAAVIPLIFWAIFCHECEAAPMLKGMAGYGLVGLTWDSFQRNTKTIYAAAPRASVSWRIGF